MTLQPGSRIGPYEITSLLGAGGMGEVWLARDGRLGRDVALKILRPSLAQDAERLRRFELEAKAVALLSHPNILQIFDTGLYEGTPYLVMELLEGETLRTRINGGPVPLRKALDIAIQVAQGLAAAHLKSITHRDLKPENIFLTGEDRVKILDFGLAKLHLTASEEPGGTLPHPVEPLETRIGAVLGTVGYMSPEQVGGRPADSRSDIFSLGVILWEMLTGVRPFDGATSVETMHAILKKEPAGSAALGLYPALRRTLARCLEKDPWARFQSARDLAFELENLALGTSSLSDPLRRLYLLRHVWLRPRHLLLGALSLTFVCGALWVGSRLKAEKPMSIQRLSYHRGVLRGARFTPDGQAYVYSYARHGDPGELRLGRLDGVGIRPLDLPLGSEILSISREGELAILLNPNALRRGVLARAPLSGGPPKEILDGVLEADWSPDGRELAVVVEEDGGRLRLDYPIGQPLYRAPEGAMIRAIRVSPDGHRVAFIEEVGRMPESLNWVDRSGHRRVISKGNFGSILWSLSGKELLATVRRSEDRQELRAITLSGKDRLVYVPTGRLRLQDHSPQGRLLVVHEITQDSLIWSREALEKDLSYLQSSHVADITRDGRGVLFAELQEGRGPGGAYFRQLDQPEAMRIGDGDPLLLAPDGRSAVIQDTDARDVLQIVPLGPGPVQHLKIPGMRIEWAAFLKGGQRLLVGGLDDTGTFRHLVRDLQADSLSPWGHPHGEAEAFAVASRDGERIALGPTRGILHIFDAEGRKIHALQDFQHRETPVGWSEDGKFLYVADLHVLPAQIWKVEVATGQRSFEKSVCPSDLSGAQLLKNVCITPDGATRVFTVKRVITSDLCSMEGWP